VTVVCAVVLVWWTVGATATYASVIKEMTSEPAKLGAFVIAVTWPISLIVGMLRGLK